MYKAEESLSTLLTFFSIITIFIACIGLFGLTAFSVIQRTKEIGIRKVVGASSTGIIKLFAVDSATLMIFSIILAIPVAWILINKWLNTFYFRISIDPKVFIFSSLFVLVLSVITVIMVAYRIAISNPVNCLKE